MVLNQRETQQLLDLLDKLDLKKVSEILEMASRDINRLEYENEQLNKKINLLEEKLKKKI